MPQLHPSAEVGSTKVLITGGTGLVGRAIEFVVKNETAPSEYAPLSNEEWVFLSSKDGDLRNLQETRAIFERHQPQFVIHLAARVGGLFKNMRDKVAMFEDNMLINMNVIHCCHEFKVQKLISCLSTCIFPQSTEYPITEEMVHQGEPHDSNYGYAYAKRMVDVMNRIYHDQHGDMFTSIIPTNIFGPHDNFNLQDSHVIPGLISKCDAAVKNQSRFVVAGSGMPMRQFIYSRDLAKLIILVLRKYNKVDPIIASVSEEAEVSISDLAQIIARSFNYQDYITFDRQQADGQMKKTASNKKIRNLAPNFQFTPLPEAIAETVQWYRENQPNCRQ